MNLKSRVRRIETVVNAPGTCATCSGRGGKTIRVWIEGEPEPPVPTCPECGRQPYSCTTVIIESGPVQVEQPDQAWTGKTVVVASSNKV